MTRVGDCIFVTLNTIDGPHNFKGICVDLRRTIAVIAVHPSPRVQAIGDVDTEAIATTAVAFVSVARSSLRKYKGDDWNTVTSLSPWPSSNATVEAFNVYRGVVTPTSSIKAADAPRTKALDVCSVVWIDGAPRSFIRRSCRSEHAVDVTARERLPRASVERCLRCKTAVSLHGRTVSGEDSQTGRHCDCR